jgi:bla regulator protein BlaR1
MSTTEHQYLATWFFDEKTISNSLIELKNATQVEINGSSKIEFDEINFNKEIYTNIYEEQVLSRENEDDVYKIIEISGTTIGANYKYRGYLVVVYDPANVKLATSKGAGTTSGSYGQILSTISKNNNALVAMNAGGFYDPNWNSNGGIPHGAVIKDGVIQSEFRRGDVGGGLIGFNKNNELVLKRMTAQEAVDAGIRDAVDWGPYLIVNGKNQYAKQKHYTWATSRTAIGQRKDGIVLMLVVDGGNQPGSYGASYADVAKIMENYGAINAANLDGGTSTALTENHQYVNNPWNGRKRTIRSLPNAWIVVK